MKRFLKTSKFTFFVLVINLCSWNLINAGWHEPHQNSFYGDTINKVSSFKFDFGDGKIKKGYIQVLPSSLYTKEKGYGFYAGSEIISLNRGGKNSLQTDFCTSKQAFNFAVDLPEGDYNVKLILGDEAGTSVTTVKAEARRLMLEKVETKMGETVTVEFTTNVRYSSISDGDNVRLKSREIGHPNWDHRLSIEFNNSSPKVCGVEIEKIDNAITVYLAGNSTVTDQQQEPWAAWGQMIPAFFNPGKVSIANIAESGETLKSFVGERRLKKISSTIKPGDYLFIEFAHNDQKPGSSHVDAFTAYKEYLKMFIEEARKHGATPVLVTSMHRRRFDDNGKIINTLEDYPEAMRQSAREENVAMIDLNEMSRIFYEAMGPEDSKHAFVHYPAGTFPGQETELKDDTHFNNYGAYELAKCIVEGIKQNKLELAEYLRVDLPEFNPAYPDSFADFRLPASPDISSVKPEGN